MRYILFSLTLLCSIVTTIVSGQGRDIIKIESKWNSDLSHIKSLENIELKVPALIQEKNQIIFSPNAQILNLDHSFPFEDHSFYSLNIPMIWQKPLLEKYKTGFIFIPSLSSAIGDYSHNAFVWTGGLYFSLNNHRKFNWQVGVLYSYRYKNNLIVPLIGFRWSQNEGINITANFPRRFGVDWDISKNMLLGLRVDNNSFSTLIPEKEDFDYAWYQERSVIPYTDIKLFKGLWFRFDLGYSYSRDFKLYKMPDENKWSFGANFNNNSTDAVWELSENGFSMNFAIIVKSIY